MSRRGGVAKIEAKLASAVGGGIFEEAKHPRLHGKFASKGGAGTAKVMGHVESGTPQSHVPPAEAARHTSLSHSTRVHGALSDLGVKSTEGARAPAYEAGRIQFRSRMKGASGAAHVKQQGDEFAKHMKAHGHSYTRSGRATFHTDSSAAVAHMNKSIHGRRL